MAMPTLLPTPWPSGPGGGFDASGEVGFGMAGSAAVQLPEPLDLIERDGEFLLRLRLCR